jgi:hypothetical protein
LPPHAASPESNSLGVLSVHNVVSFCCFVACFHFRLSFKSIMALAIASPIKV